MIESVQAPAREHVLAALRNAAARTGSDFDYLVGTAMRESSLNAHAKAPTSSATGLFQFLDQTWLATVKAHGAEYGLGRYADAIHQNANGRYAVDSPEMKQEILGLRKDPQIAAFMAGEAAEDIRESLQSSLCRPVTCGELYAAHFLGEGGARKLLTANDTDPSARADQIFPQAARANRGVFYHRDGTSKTVGEVYTWAVRLPEAKGVGAEAPADAPAQRNTFANMDIASTEHTFPGLVDDYEDDSVARYRTYSSGTGTGSPSIAALLPHAPLVLLPGVLEVLASLSPTTTTRETED